MPIEIVFLLTFVLGAFAGATALIFVAMAKAGRPSAWGIWYLPQKCFLLSSEGVVAYDAPSLAVAHCCALNSVSPGIDYEVRVIG